MIACHGVAGMAIKQQLKRVFECDKTVEGLWRRCQNKLHCCLRTGLLIADPHRVVLLRERLATFGRLNYLIRCVHARC